MKIHVSRIFDQILKHWAASPINVVKREVVDHNGRYLTMLADAVADFKRQE